MTKAFKIILLLLFINQVGHCCTCRDEGFSYEFYKTLKHCFIGTVIKIKTDNQKFSNEYTFRIKYIYKGKFDTIIQIKSGTGGGDCGEIFELNRTYLIDASYDKKDKILETSSCRFNALKGTKEFQDDTMLLNLFSKKSVFINLPGIKGHIKNGKPTGFWVVGGDSGIYKNGKMHGIWKTSYGNEIYYRKGNFIKNVEYVENEQKTDSFKVITGRSISKRYYPNGKIHKIRKRRTLVIYYPNGALKEKMKLNKHGFVYGFIYKYDEKGNILEKKYVENDNSEEADYHFLLD